MKGKRTRVQEARGNAEKYINLIYVNYGRLETFLRSPKGSGSRVVEFGHFDSHVDEFSASPYLV